MKDIWYFSIIPYIAGNRVVYLMYSDYDKYKLLELRHGTDEKISGNLDISCFVYRYFLYLDTRIDGLKTFCAKPNQKGL